jgi:hypothetical protein
MMAMRAAIAGVVGAAALVALAEQPRFSRSRWIAERARHAPFSGGVLPGAAVPLPIPAVSGTALPAAAGRKNVRVSFDLLEPDGSAAQPETQAEPHVAINPEDDQNLLAGYQDQRFSDGGARALTYAVSTDGGRHWSEALLPNLTRAAGGSFERASDPWVAFGPDQRAYFVSLAFNETNPLNGIYVSASSDGGRTFADPVAVHTTTVDFDDKEAMAVDSGEASPHRGNVYVAWDRNTAGGLQVLELARSTDGGVRWSTPVALDRAPINIGVVPLVGPDGTVYAVWIHSAAGSPEIEGDLVCARSTDGGRRWRRAVVIARVDSIGVPELRTGNGLPMAAVDPASGAIYVVWQDQRFTPSTDQVVLSRSTDSGRSWSAPLRISDGPDQAASFTPAVAVNGRGEVGVAYSSLRNDPQRRYLVDQYFCGSQDGGISFGASVRVSRVTTDVRFAAQARGYFLGDYQGIAGGARRFHPLWIATLNASRIDGSRPQPDAFTARVK